jgi:hypothetical protein
VIVTTHLPFLEYGRRERAGKSFKQWLGKSINKIHYCDKVKRFVPDYEISFEEEYKDI